MKFVAWIALLFATSLLGQSLQWKPNTEPDLAGYRLYVYGPTNLVTTLAVTDTNYSLGLFPPGRYEFLLTAYNTLALESEPAGPLLWTNANLITVVFDLQRSSTLTGQWVRILSVTNSEPKTNQAFYRLEISPR